MKILTLDIETIPSSGYIWGLFDQNIGLNQLITEGATVCWAAKWTHESRVMFGAAWDPEGDWLQRIWDLLDEADVVVHFNGKSFDIPHLNRAFLQAGMPPPQPYKQVDLLLVARKQFNFVSNKLAHIVSALGLGFKMDTGGFELWRDVMVGDPEARAQMRRYNRQDVRITEALYLKLLPWIPGHPNRRLYDSKAGCPVCGGADLWRRGYAYTAASVFVKYQCQTCKSYSRAAKRENGVSVQEAVR